MEHAPGTAVLAVVAGCVVAWGLVSARLERVSITPPIAFVVLGFLVSNGPWALIHVELHSSTVRVIAEVTLAIVLFADAARVNVDALRADAAVPGRLLGLGLPMTIAAGTAAALLVSGGDLWVAAVIGASVAPTDAALGATILHDTRVPGRVRRLLNVESGLNDGIATPFVSFFIAGAVAADVAHGPTPASALVEIALGVGMGIGVGLGGAWLLNATRRLGWSAPAFRPLAVLGLGLLSYAGAVEAGGNGFVAAFVGGMAFGSLSAHTEETELTFTDDIGELLSLLVWFLFGAAIVPAAFEHLDWADVVFAVLALTVVRMVPVAIALIGAGTDRATVAFVGWFGPRGLASVVFALVAVDALAPADGDRVLAVVTLTILFSVAAHGLTSSPLAARYGTYWARAHPGPEPPSSTPELRARSMAGARRRAYLRPGESPR